MGCSGGATAEQKDLAKKQAQFFDTMTQQQNQQFAGQTAILDSLRRVQQPIVEAGPNQEGFNQATKNILNTQAIEGTANEYKKVSQARREQMAARGDVVPSGVDEKQLNEIATAGAQDAATKRLQIAQANYDRGWTNFNNASAAMSGNAQIYNPIGTSGAATGAGGLASQSADTVQKANAAGSWGSVLGGIVGGGLQAFTGGFGGALGKAVGGGKNA